MSVFFNKFQYSQNADVALKIHFNTHPRVWVHQNMLLLLPKIISILTHIWVQHDKKTCG